MLKIFYIAHVFSIIALTGTVFSAAAAPIPSRRKKCLMWSGIASLGVFLTGFGLAGMMHYGFPLWIIVKIACWFLISGIVGMFFRKPQKASQFLITVMVAVVVALAMVYYVKPA
jgi:hypothetical protein